MDTKNKDFVFSIVLLFLGGYVFLESRAMVARAAKPPFNVADFSISPGMLPLILGVALIACSLILLVCSLRGEKNPFAMLSGHVKATAGRLVRAPADPDMRSMAVSIVIMAVYTFFILGRMPFWLGAFLFTTTLMIYVRAGKLWMIFAASGVSLAAIILLFENFFKTTLP